VIKKDGSFNENKKEDENFSSPSNTVATMLSLYNIVKIAAIDANVKIMQLSI
jgi:hypothetical protein